MFSEKIRFIGAFVAFPGRMEVLQNVMQSCNGTLAHLISIRAVTRVASLRMRTAVFPLLLKSLGSYHRV